MIFDKKALPIEEQITLLKNRGMLITDEAKAKIDVTYPQVLLKSVRNNQKY
jgi:hypothetical protein